MNTILLVLAITEGTTFLAVLIRFSYQAGRVIQRIENHDRRIVALETDVKETLK